MIHVELVDSRKGTVVGELVSPIVPSGEQIQLLRADENGGDPGIEIWYIEGVAESVYGQDRPGAPFMLQTVRLAVSQSWVSTHAVKV